MLETETRRLFEAADRPHEPRSTAELADTLDRPVQPVRDALETLADRGYLQTKEIDGQLRVWWRPASDTRGDTSEHSGDQRDVSGDSRKRLDLFENVQDIASVGAWEYDIESEQGWWTEEVSRIYGLPTDYVAQPEESLQFYHPDDRATVRETFERAVEHDEEYDIEVRLIDTNGDVHWVRTRCEVDVEDGEPVRVYGTLQDITDRKQRERELERLNQAIEAAPIGVVMTDPDRDENPLVYVNERFQEMTGYPEPDILGKNCRFLQGEATDDDPRDRLREAIDSAVPTTVELRNYTSDGTEFWNRLSIAPVEDEDGEVRHFVGFQEDVTARKRKETALQKRERTIREIQRATQDLLGAHTEPDVANVLVNCLTAIHESLTTRVLWFDQDSGVLRSPALASPTEWFEGDLTVEPGSNAVWDAYRDGQTTSVSENERAALAGDTEPPTGELVAVPIGDFGVLLASTTNSSFDENTLDAIELLVGTAEAVLERIEQRQTADEISEQVQAYRNRITELQAVMETSRTLQEQLADSETREAVETRVCEELVSTEGIKFAWIGHPQTTDTDLSPAAWAGTDRGYFEIIDEASDGRLPAHQAATCRARETVPRISRHVRSDNWAKTALSCGFKSVVALPVVYDDVLYGVLTVYASQAETFGDVYETLLESVVSMLETHISTLGQRADITETESIELEFRLTDSQYPVHTLAVNSGASIRFETVLERSDETIRVLLSVTEGSVEQVVTAAEEMTQIRASRRFGDQGSGQVSLTVGRPFLTTEVRNHGGRLVSATSDGDQTHVRIRLPTNASHRPLVESLASRYQDIDLVSQRHVTDPTVGGPVGPEELLTDRQFEVLRAAYYGGYYETPRETTAEDIANDFDISQPVVYNHLQAAQRTLLAHQFSPRDSQK